MLVFFVHGINTQDSYYAKYLIKNICKEFSKRGIEQKPNFYSSFWGNLFNNKKHKITEYIARDFSRACESVKSGAIPRNDIYRYQKQRNLFINNFLGDFLIYQNIERGNEIRKVITTQLEQFIKDNPGQKEIHFVSHSLGSIVLWDLLFSQNNDKSGSLSTFQKILTGLNLVSITTMGSPLLFFKEMLDLNFSSLDLYTKSKNDSINNQNSLHALRWVNIIHSSDLVAYPLKSAAEKEINPKILLSDQYIWRDANSTETLLHITKGQSDAAMVVAAEDAHSSYLNSHTSGRIAGRIISHNLLGETKELLEKLVSGE